MESKEPTSIRSGDSYGWKRSLSQYPASSGWELAYRLVSQSSGDAHDIASSASGDDHVVSLTAATTADWLDGQYTLVGSVTKASERVTIYIDACTVLPDLMRAGASDQRGSAQKIVDAIDSWMSTKATWAGEKQIADRRIKDHDLVQLMQLREYYAGIARTEAATAALFAGTGASTRINVAM